MGTCTLSVWEVLLSGLGTLGSLASVVGIVLTYRQAAEAKSAADSAAEAAKAVSTRYNREYSISTVAHHNETIELVRQYLRKKQYPSAETKMRDIQKCIIELREVPELSHHYDLQDLNSLLERLRDDILSISTLEENEAGLNTDRVLENLNNINIFFESLQAKLKYHPDAS